MNSVSRWCAYALATLSFVSAPVSYAGEISIAYVDLDKALVDVEEGQEAQKNLTRERDKRQQEAQAKEAELARNMEDFRKQVRVLSPPAISRQAEKLEQDRIALNQLVMEIQKNLSKKSQELFGPIEDKLKELVRTIANREGYDMILNKRSVPFGRKDLDLTDKLIQEYNRTYVTVKKPIQPTTKPTKPATP